jgi:hypothetical protein
MTNNLNIRTFNDLFKNCRDIQIPIYQRAYSWDREQYEQFYEDLIEQSGKPYHFGLFIFEHSEQGTYFVIDGQQRLTTAVLFLAALAKIKTEKNITDIKGTYLSGGFTTVNDDNDYFKQLIINFSCGEKKAETPSQRKIKEAFDYFCKRLEKEKSEKATDFLGSLEKAKIGIFEIDNKGEASQVFEYQNNRGVHASDFEIIKAYLIHQIYIKSKDSETDINEIQKNISVIYRNLEAISEQFTENDILWCWFYLYEFSQYIEYDIEGIKWCLSPENEDKPVTDICEWIKVFFTTFEKITNAAKILVSKSKISSEIANLFLIGTSTKSTKPYWPVVMLAVIIKETKVDNDQVYKLAKLLEILWFKYEYCNRRVDSLPEWAYNYYNELSEEKLSFNDLCEKINNAIASGFDGRFPEFKNAVDNYLREKEHFWYRTATRYLLWQYENDLRKEEGLPKLGNKKYRTYNEIEHIKAQKSDFPYVHGLGNLALLTSRDNKIASAKEFKEKKQDVYSKYYDKKKPTEAKLLMYRDILSKSDWRREQEVNERFNKIKEFAKKYFSL